MGAFGEKLRKQREQSGIGLDAISNTTKISTRMLRALEDEHFEQLPGGVFNKGFVRAYARQVGLNEEEAIADYLAAVRESQVHENQVQAHSGSPDVRDRVDHLPGHDHPGNDSARERGRQLLTGERRKQLRRNEDRRNEDRRNENRRNENQRHQDPSSSTDSAKRFRQKYPAGTPELPAAEGIDNDESAAQVPWGKLAVALLVVTLVLALWNSRRHREPTSAPRPPLASSQAPAAAPVPALTSHSKPLPSAASPLKPGKISPAGSSPSGKLPPGTTTAESATTATAPSANSSPTSPAPEQSIGQSTRQSTASAAPANPRTSFSVLIRADETSWVSITADGKPVAHETLIAPAHTSVRASGEVVVKAGNAAGISFELNGKEIPAQGNEGEVKTYVFDAAGFRVLPQPQSPATVR